MAKWDEGRKATLRRMWLEGATSSDIARELGGVSRNAVMGMVDRLGLMRSADHHALSTARRSGCCAAGYRKASWPGLPDVEAQEVETPETVAEVEAAPQVVAVIEAVAPEIEATVAPAAAEPAPPLAANDDSTMDDALDAPDVPAQARSTAAPRPVRKARPGEAGAAARVPSSRPWRPAPSVSRMPPRRAELPPPGEVVIGSGVMASLRSIRPGTAEWRDVFSTLQRLTGVPYDERIPGHAPALVAIATVIAGGDPRSVLLPAVPETAVLRFMRRFAEKGLVVAGKAPARWTEEGDDRAFYDEMVSLAA